MIRQILETNANSNSAQNTHIYDKKLSLKKSLFSLFCEKKRKRSDVASLRFAFRHRAFASLRFRFSIRKKIRFRFAFAIRFRPKLDTLHGTIWDLFIAFGHMINENYDRDDRT